MRWIQQQSFARRGGIIDASVLRRRCPAGRITQAIKDGTIVRLRRGRYGVGGMDEAARLSIELTGTISHLSAALVWGWKVKDPPAVPQITVPRGRKLSPAQRRRAQIHWQDGVSSLVDQCGVRLTTPLETVVGCLKTEPFDAALAVADSALRSGRIRRAELLDAIACSSRPGRARALRVAKAADRRAANPFESVLRAICLDVRGLQVTPQVQIGPHRVDLADEALGIAVEADSREFHAGPAEHDADIRRYTTLVRNGWIVIRFSYSDVMHDQAYVAQVLADAVALARATRTGRNAYARAMAA